MGGLNTNGYVGGNLLSYTGPYGLLPEDYSAAQEILRDYAARNGQRVPDRIGIGLPPLSDAIGASGHTRNSDLKFVASEIEKYEERGLTITDVASVLETRHAFMSARKL